VYWLFVAPPALALTSGAALTPTKKAAAIAATHFNLFSFDSTLLPPLGSGY
jgi:hypothetical protein